MHSFYFVSWVTYGNGVSLHTGLAFNIPKWYMCALEYVCVFNSAGYLYHCVVSKIKKNV